MTRIAVLSDCRLPTLPLGGHGLGRMAWDIAEGLHAAGHDVTLCAGPHSQAPDGVLLVLHEDETTRAESMARGALHYDALVDLSHFHDLSQLKPEWPVVNWLVDIECPYEPPNIVTAGEWHGSQVKSSRRVPLGIPVKRYPFVEEPEDYILFAGKLHHLKGPDLAFQIAARTDEKLVVIGDNMGGYAIPSEVVYLGPIADNRAFNAWLSNAKALLMPSRLESGGRVILEAAACGVPTVTLDWSGTRDHVQHGVSGFVCRDPFEMVDALADVPLLDRFKARVWCEQNHDRKAMIDGLVGVLQAVGNGERW